VNTKNIFPFYSRSWKSEQSKKNYQKKITSL